jgi:hypothetical protein
VGQAVDTAGQPVDFRATNDKGRLVPALAWSRGLP